jgi:hypothetical protein
MAPHMDFLENTMKRLHPEERKYIVNQTCKRLQHDWICRYGLWNTNKLLNELRLKLRWIDKPDINNPATEDEPASSEASQALLFN